jgi:hypothetical protein
MSTNEIAKYTDDELQAEIDRRRDLKAKTRFLYINQNLSFVNLIRQAPLENLNWITHTCKNCTDENPANHYLDNGAIRCVRCWVMVTRNNSDYLDLELEATLRISTRVAS